MPVPLAAVMALAGAGISGGASIFDSYMQRKTSKENVAAQNAHNMELARYNASQNLALWEKANQYNAPAMQMERFKAAGLNPNLIYGQMSNVSPATPAPVQASSQSIEPMKIAPAVAGAMDNLSTFQNYQLRETQIKNMDSVTNLNKQKLAHDIIKQSGTLTSNEKKALEKQMYEELMPTRIHREPYIAGQMGANVRKTELEIQILKKRLEAADDTNAIIAKKAEVARLEAEMKRYRKEKLLKSGLEMNDPYYVKLMYELMRTLTTE